MSCNVRINANGQTEVVADNGQKSILFEEAKKITSTESEALDVWAVGQTPLFKDSFVYPKVAAYINKVFKTLDRMSNKIVETPTKSLIKEYTDRISAIKKSDPKNYWSVDMPTKSEIASAAKEGRIVATNGGMAIVTTDGSLIGLFKDDATQKGVAKTLQEARVDIGGIKLDNFDGYLTKIYQKNGFKVVSRLRFNEEVAPKDWKKSENGTPDVVFMIYDKNGDLDITEKVFEKDQYDEAAQYRDSFIEQAKEIHPFYTNKLDTTPIDRIDPRFSKSIEEKVEEVQKTVEKVDQAIEDEFNINIASGNTIPTIGKQTNPNAEIDIESLRDRAEVNKDFKVVKMDMFKDIPFTFGISDELRIGNVVNPISGNEIDNLKGGLGFALTSGHEGIHWANVDKSDAEGQLSVATMIYEANKEIFKKAWEEGRLPYGQIPVAIVKMSESAIDSNEAVLRTVLDSFRSAKGYKTKKVQKSLIEAFDKDLQDIQKTIEDKISELNSKLKKGLSDTAKTSINKNIKIKQNELTILNTLINHVEVNINGGFDKLLQSVVDHRNGVGKDFTLKEIKIFIKFLITSKTKTRTALAETGFKSTLNIAKVRGVLKDPAYNKDVGTRDIIAVTGINVLEPEVMRTSHPHYPWGLKGGLIGILSKPESMVDIFPTAVSNVIQRLSDKSQPKLSSALASGVPTSMGLSNIVFRGSTPMQNESITEEELVAGALKIAFPGINFSLSQESWDFAYAKIKDLPEYKKFVGKDGKVEGFTDGNSIFMNPEFSSTKVLLHETTHIWADYMKKKNPKLWEVGENLVEGTAELNAAKEIYGDTALAREEAIANLIASKGQSILDSNKRLGFEQWLSDVFNYLIDSFTSTKELKNRKDFNSITLEEFLEAGVRDVLSGELVDSSVGAYKSIVKDSPKGIRMSIATFDDTGFITPESMVKIVSANNPAYLATVVNHISTMRDRLKRGEVGIKDVAKAYLISVSSTISTTQTVKSYEKATGRKVDETFISNGKIRPESGMAFFLQSEDGLELLDKLERGTISREDLNSMITYVKPFGVWSSEEGKIKNVFHSNKGINLKNLNEIVDILKKGIANPTSMFEAVGKLSGISEGKVGFVSQFLGIGTRGVVDTREISAWLTGKNVKPSTFTSEQKQMSKTLLANTKKGDLLREEMFRRMEIVAAEFGVPKEFAQYLGHHMIWDAIGKEQTTHEEIYNVMRGNRPAFDAGIVPELKQVVEEGSKPELNNNEIWDESRGPQILEGAPIIKARANVTGADPELTFLAEEYARRNDIDYKRQTKYVEIDVDRAKRIAQAYEEMEHNPQDPVVKEAFENLIQQTTAQYNLLQEAGYEFYFFDETNDPYNGNPWAAMEDLRTNKQMAVFTTEAGFGSGETELNVEDNPMLADTGIEWSFGEPGGPKRRVLANDLFRAVHDAFGHGLEGSGFRDRGEENAWQSHARLFTGSAIAAITSETRGQNSWLNYGKYGEQNRTAKIEDTVFADQKTGLMPEWTWKEGFDTGVSKALVGGANFANFFADVTNTKNGGANFNNVSEILQKPVEGYEEELKAYLKYGGNFQKHIMASIPGFVDSRIRVLKAMADVSVILGKGAKPVNMLDITSSEGYFTKAYAQLAQDKGVNAKADALDAGVTFQRDFQSTPQVKGVNFLLEAWGEGFTDPGTGTVIPLFKPTKKYGVVFEGMGFQFFTPTREKEIKEVKDMMEDNGLFISMQKLKNPDYARREILKDEYKSQFFSQETLKQKAATVLAKSDENAVGMMDYQYDRVEYEKVLAKNFKYVVQIYSSGNFAGYYATDSKQVIEKALESTGDTTTKFNEEATPKVISGEVSTVKVNKSKIQVKTTLVNGIKGYTAYDENGVKIGVIRTKAYQQGEVITGVTVNEEFRGQGIGKGLYVHVIKGLIKQGKVLYSDKSRAAGAEIIWQQLVEKGVAQRNSDNTYQTKPSPSGVDQNGEARAEDVKNFIDKQDVIETLTSKELQDLSLSLTTTKFNSSGELLKALQKAFLPNGHFAPTKNSLTLSDIYSKVEMNNIMNSPDLQTSIKEFIYKLENTDEEVTSEDIGDERFMVAEQGMPVNLFGKFQVANPFITEKNAINELGGVKTEAELENAINDSELGYLKGQKELLPLFSKFEKLTQKTFVDGVLSDKPINDTENLFNNILETGEQMLLSDAVKAIFTVDDTVYQDYPNETKILLKVVDRLAVNIGLDLKGLDEVYDKKSPEQMKDFLVGMIALIESNQIKGFAEIYNKFFEVDTTPKKVVQQVAEKDKGKALVSVITDSKAYSLFEAEGLVAIGNNLYQKTNAKDLTLQEVYEIAFEKSKIDPTIFPDNVKSLVEIKAHIQEQARGIDVFKVDNVDSEVLQKMAAYVILNKGEMNNDREFPSVESELQLMNGEGQKVAPDFVKEFYKEQLKQSRANSQVYKDFYSKFEVTGEGIELINNDPITVKQIESQIEGYPELAQYFNSKIGSDITFPDNTELEQDYDDSNLRNYYANHPQALPVYKGITQKVNDRTMEIKSTEAFLRLPSGVYEFNSSKGETSLYSELILNDTNKKDYELNVAPIRLDNKGVNNNQEVEKKNKNLYNKSEGGEIDENLSCN